MPNNKTLFVLRHEDGDIEIATKEQVTSHINNVERLIVEHDQVDETVTFETIAKIAAGRLHMDITIGEIEWYKPEFKQDKKLTDEVILKAVQYLLER